MHVDILAFGAHPDDIELTCAGTLVKLIRAGHKVGLIDVTGGERGSRGSAEERKKEAEEAASIMQVSFRHRMNLQDGAIAVNGSSIRTVVELIRKHKPRLVVAPHWKVAHPDHSDVSRMVLRGAFYAGLPKWEAEGEPHRPKGVIYHMSRLPFRPSFIVDVSETFDVRLKAIEAYKSQHYKEDLKPVGYIHKKWFLDSITGRARHYGALIGADFGEPFFVREAIRVEDPFSLFPTIE